MPDPRPIRPEELLKFWYDALRNEHGLIIPVANPDDAEAIRHDLYEARRDISDPKIETLSLHLSPDKTTITLHKRPDGELT